MSGVAAATRLGTVDRVLYALFARRADDARHAVDRKRYRGANLRVSFDVFLARLYGLAWTVGLATVGVVLLAVLALPASVVAAVGDVAPPFVSVSRPTVGVAVAASGGLVARGVVLSVGSLYLRWAVTVRRADIERTLPAAVRYLYVLSSGTDSPRTMLRKVADADGYGETAVAARKTLNTAAIAGSLDAGLRRVARDTPSRDLLGPFLLKFAEHADQGDDALRNYLRMESRMLDHRQAQTRQRAEGFLELVAELFVVLLVLPALLVIVVTVMSTLAPGLTAPVATPLGPVSMRVLAVYGSAVFVLFIGLAAAALVGGFRPADQRVTYRRPAGVVATLRTALSNPASAAAVCAVPALAVAAGFLVAGVRPVNVALAGYVAYALPVGAVASRRSRLDDGKDREIADFVHAVSGHVSLGRPFPEAVESVASEVSLGPLDGDVADLAFTLRLTTGSEGGLRRTAALSGFTERVGTPLVRRTMGMVTGALDAGSDAEAVFETLQAEVGRLHHEKLSLQSLMSIHVAVGWTTALLVVATTVAVSTYVVGEFAALSPSGVADAAFDPSAIDPERERVRFYIVTQATVLAAGLFAGMASRGIYEALLHSGTLVVVCYGVFAGVGLL